MIDLDQRHDASCPADIERLLAQAVMENTDSDLVDVVEIYGTGPGKADYSDRLIGQKRIVQCDVEDVKIRYYGSLGDVPDELTIFVDGDEYDFVVSVGCCFLPDGSCNLTASRVWA